MSLTHNCIEAVIKERNGRIWGMLLFGEIVKPTGLANELDLGCERCSGFLFSFWAKQMRKRWDY